MNIKEIFYELISEAKNGKVLISDETAKELDLEGILSISIIRF